MTIAAIASTTTSPLVSHLLAQGAPRAAERIATSATELCTSKPFAVPRDTITVVDDAESAASFSHEVRQQPLTIAAFDAEWRPEPAGSVVKNLPSLLQIATAERVWLLDLESSIVLEQTMDAVIELFESHATTKLGYGVQTDIDKLQLLYAPRDRSLAPRRVLDLRAACCAAQGDGGGLSLHLSKWVGRTLDKREQCSDWRRRPLREAQICYAANDAACLIALHEALLAAASAGDPLLLSSSLREADFPPLPLSIEEEDASHSSKQPSSSLPLREDGEEDEEIRQTIAQGLETVRSLAIRANAILVGADGTSTSSSSSPPPPRVVVHERGDGQRGEGRLEINSLCFTAGPLGLLLVLVPASERVDLRWLSLVTGVGKRKLKLASHDECIDLFGAVPGLVPPVPLRQGIRVLCHPDLRTSGAAGEAAATTEEAWASASDPAHWLAIRDPSASLPALAAAAFREATSDDDDISVAFPPPTLDGSGGKESLLASSTSSIPFAWLPSPRVWLPTLEDALERIHRTATIDLDEGGGSSSSNNAATGPRFDNSGGGGGIQAEAKEEAEGKEAEGKEAEGEEDGYESGPRDDIKLLLDQSLSVLARKLRMVGLDAQLAGEVVKPSQEPGMMLSPAFAAAANADPEVEKQALAEATAGAGAAALGGGDIRGARRMVGLLRVGIDASLVEKHQRQAALEGRLMIMSPSKRTYPSHTLPGAAYRLLATDAASQFAELLSVLRIEDIVDAGGSRCGICNGNDWYTLRPSQVQPGQVPPAVLKKQHVFYRCGKCQQIFWPGDKYENTMEGLRQESNAGGDAAAPPAATSPAVEPRRAGTAGSTWRPPVGTTTATAKASADDDDDDGSSSERSSDAIGRQIRERGGTLHSTQRVQLGVPPPRRFAE